VCDMRRVPASQSRRSRCTRRAAWLSAEEGGRMRTERAASARRVWRAARCAASRACGPRLLRRHAGLLLGRRGLGVALGAARHVKTVSATGQGESQPRHRSGHAVPKTWCARTSTCLLLRGGADGRHDAARSARRTATRGHATRRSRSGAAAARGGARRAQLQRARGAGEGRHAERRRSGGGVWASAATRACGLRPVQLRDSAALLSALRTPAAGAGRRCPCAAARGLPRRAWRRGAAWLRWMSTLPLRRRCAHGR
jgi:hypothetical protein